MTASHVLFHIISAEVKLSTHVPVLALVKTAATAPAPPTPLTLTAWPPTKYASAENGGAPVSLPTATPPALIAKVVGGEGRASTPRRLAAALPLFTSTAFSLALPVTARSSSVSSWDESTTAASVATYAARGPPLTLKMSNRGSAWHQKKEETWAL